MTKNKKINKINKYKNLYIQLKNKNIKRGQVEHLDSFYVLVQMKEKFNKKHNCSTSLLKCTHTQSESFIQFTGVKCSHSTVLVKGELVSDNQSIQRCFSLPLNQRTWYLLLYLNSQQSTNRICLTIISIHQDM